MDVCGQSLERPLPRSCFAIGMLVLLLVALSEWLVWVYEWRLFMGWGTKKCLLEMSWTSRDLPHQVRRGGTQRLLRFLLRGGPKPLQSVFFCRCAWVLIGMSAVLWYNNKTHKPSKERVLLYCVYSGHMTFKSSSIHKHHYSSVPLSSPGNDVGPQSSTESWKKHLLLLLFSAAGERGCCHCCSQLGAAGAPGG